MPGCQGKIIEIKTFLSNLYFNVFFAAIVSQMNKFIPIPADYDGDAKADPAVKLKNGNEWIVMFSAGGYVPVLLTIQFE